MTKDAKRQYEELAHDLQASGLQVETDHRRIAARYRDRDLADAVPRSLMYVDIGVLLGRIDKLEAALNRDGFIIMEDTPELYDAARDACHSVGLPWTDPRTGQTHPPPKP